MKNFLSVIILWLILSIDCFANDLRISTMGDQLIDLYKKNALSCSKDIQEIPKNDRLNVLVYLVNQYLNNNADFAERHPIKFIHTMISVIYPDLKPIITKYNWEELSDKELKQLSTVSYHLFLKISKNYPDKIDFVQSLKRYVAESAIEYLSRLFEDHKKELAQSFIGQFI